MGRDPRTTISSSRFPRSSHRGHGIGHRRRLRRWRFRGQAPQAPRRRVSHAAERAQMHFNEVCRGLRVGWRSFATIACPCRGEQLHRLHRTPFLCVPFTDGALPSTVRRSEVSSCLSTSRPSRHGGHVRSGRLKCRSLPRKEIWQLSELLGDGVEYTKDIRQRLVSPALLAIPTASSSVN